MQLYETDWLSSKPVFYNDLTGKVSYNVNDVIDYTNLEFDPEGLNNYLDFGYSVFEQTPVKHVKFLRHSSRLMVNDNGRIEIECLDDPLEKWIGKTSHEHDILQLLSTTVRCWEKSVEGEIILPTSGGYDSRLLNFFIDDKSRIRSFTYGLSDNQAESFEVVYARKLSEILGTRWEQIELGDFHSYFSEWDRIFGISTHAHGMYHIEFYGKILPRLDGGNAFLSGIFGDVWAGNVTQKRLQSPGDLILLGYTHGLNADSTKSMLPSDRPIREHFWDKIRSTINDQVVQTTTLIRLKMILISYLLSVPIHFGFKPWSPFLDESIALGMATLTPERRNNRIWQKEFFQKCGLDMESMNLPVSYENTLNHQALRKIPVLPLDSNLLREVIDQNYIEWINRVLSAPSCTLREMALNKLLRVRKIGGALKRLGVAVGKERRLAYSAYLVLMPIQNLLKRRNKT